MQNIKKDQRSDIKNTLIVTLKTPGQSQLHKDNRNIQLLLKSSDIFFHLKHSWTLTAYYTWHTSTEESECEFIAIEWNSVTTSSNKQWTTSISSTISGALAWGSEADAKKEIKNQHISRHYFPHALSSFHSGTPCLWYTYKSSAGSLWVNLCLQVLPELALWWATVSLHIKYRTTETL